MSGSSTTTERLNLDSNSLHVWLIHLNSSHANEMNQTDEAARQLTKNLSTIELNRATSFSRPGLRHRYLLVRNQVRNCLARYTGIHPRELNLEPDAQGKPRLKNAPTPLEFNLSHSGDYLALTVSGGMDIGIDLEQASSNRSWHAIAKRFFHPEELAQLMALPELQRHFAFYHWWTLKEAFFKARGTGIATGLEKVIFDLREAKIHYRFSADLEENIDSWQFRQCPWEDNYYLALACKAPCDQPLKLILHHCRLTDELSGNIAPLALAMPLMASSA